MATLSVLKFDSADGAEKGLTLMEDLQKQALIKLVDAAVVSWPMGARKPKTRQLVHLAGAGALDGAFWGMLFGLIFFIPFIGMAVGALAGALSGHFSDYGIDDGFIAKVREEVTEGTSALFLLTSEVTLDKVEDAFKGEHMELIESNLSKAQEAQLREHFGTQA
jgi:uncharacterized membrane protein